MNRGKIEEREIKGRVPWVKVLKFIIDTRSPGRKIKVRHERKMNTRDEPIELYLKCARFTWKP